MAHHGSEAVPGGTGLREPSPISSAKVAAGAVDILTFLALLNDGLPSGKPTNNIKKL